MPDEVTLPSDLPPGYPWRSMFPQLALEQTFYRRLRLDLAYEGPFYLHWRDVADAMRAVVIPVQGFICPRADFMLLGHVFGRDSL